MESLTKWFVDLFLSEVRYLWSEATLQTGWQNYFWMLTLLSLLVLLGEKLFPWRQKQPLFRKQFWLDCFYMYFNFFIFKLLIFSFVTSGSRSLIALALGKPLNSFALFDMTGLPLWLQLLLFFLALDFVQWATHVALHRFDLLWHFHAVHHSVEEMSFAAHLRFHWMEHVVYTPVKYITVALLFGTEPQAVYGTYVFATVIGHINHANMNISYGPLKYLINNPVMHIWHHSKKLPKDHRMGVNFGISLSLWDYIFRTAYIPSNGRDIALGFPGVESYPDSFLKQMIYPFTQKGE